MTETRAGELADLFAYTALIEPEGGMSDLQTKMAEGEPLMQQALDAMRRYHEARNSLIPAEKLDRLRLEAESLMQAVSEYQQSALGGPVASRH